MNTYRFLCISLLFWPLIIPGHCLGFDNWPTTGQEKCYGTPGIGSEFVSIDCPVTEQEDHYGQDFQYENLQLPRSYSKLDENGNALPDSVENWVMVRDNVTGLIWEVKTDDDSIHDRDKTFVWCDPSDPVNIGECPAGPGPHDAHTREFIVTLNNNKFGGFNQWRLPTIKELSSLTHAGQPDRIENLASNPSLDVAYFPEARPNEMYWTSTSVFNDEENAWYLSSTLGNTYINRNKSEHFHVRAVLGKSSAAVADFTDNHNGTITDNTTGLIWQQETSATRMTWKEALAYCEQSTLNNQTDWRLPNRKELQSLVDYTHDPATRFPETLPALHPYYWSSTTNSWHTNNGWYVYFSTGQLLSGSKSDPLYVRPVRGRQRVGLEVELKGDGSGVVSSSPAGIHCPTDCSERGTYHAGDLITLTAIADPGFRFTGWNGGGCSGVGPCTVVMNRNITLTATFLEAFPWNIFLPAIITAD